MPENKKLAQLNNLLDRKVDAGMAKTRQWKELWQEAISYIFSEQLADKRRHKDWDWVIQNYIWPSVMQEVAKLSKNHPKIIVHPWEDNDADVAETWESKLQWDWRKGLTGRDMRLDQMEAIFDGKCFGYRVSKIYWRQQDIWDEESQQWNGNVRYRLWHPAQFWATGEEKIDDGDCGTYRYATLEWAISRWPKFEKELRLEAAKLTKEMPYQGDVVRGSASTGTTAALAAGVYAGGSEKDHKGLVNRIVGLIFGSKQEAGEGQDDRQFVKIEEIYFKDETEEDVAIEEDIPKEELIANGTLHDSGEMLYDAKTNKPFEMANWPRRIVKQYKRPRFPNGRFVIRCGKTILNPDELDQKYPYSRWPFIVIPHYLLPHMWQGLNAVELYKSTQDMINISVSHLFNNMKLFGDPKVAIEQDAIALNPRTGKHFRVGAGAGAIIRLVRGGLARMKIIDPPAPSMGTLMLYRLFAQEFKNLTGMQSVAMGEKEQGRMTATQAQHLAISAHDRIALQSAYEDEWIRQVMGLVAEISQKNYDLQRWVRIVGEDNIAGAIQITQRMKQVRFDIDIVPASTLPFDDEKRKASYMAVYNLLSNPNPNPMLPDVMRIFEIQGWKKILARHRTWQLWMQFLSLVEAVRAGEIAPQDAINLLVQRTAQELANQQALPAMTGGKESAGSFQQLRPQGRQGAPSQWAKQGPRAK